jgi:Rrf2 family cysteine metabolism transcriptional repressor
MFTVTAKGMYGLTAMVHLAQSYSAGPIQIKDIAETHSIPQHYLEQILVSLKKTGMIESFRGAQGGYALAQHPSQIEIKQILIHLEGKLSIIPDGQKSSVLDFFWHNLEQSIDRLLDKNLEELTQEVENAQQSSFYSI